MNRHFVRALLAGAALLFGCARPGDRSPPGFVDACYGGRHDMARNWVMSDDRMSLSIKGEEKDWPQIAKIVSDTAGPLGMKFFDTSSSTPDYIRALGLSICDPSGIYLHVDERVYLGKAAGQQQHEDDRITITLRTYKRTADWRPLANAVEARMRAQWPDAVEVKFPPLVNVPLSHMALPDNVRAQLQGECRVAPDPRPYYCEGEPRK